VNTGSIVLGLLNGLSISLLAAGFVLVYKANRFLNLAHAQLGAVSATLLVKLVNDVGWSFWLAAPVAVATGIVVGGLTEVYLVRPVRARSQSAVRLLMLSVGVSQLLLALTFIPLLAPDTEEGFAFPQPFDSSLEIAGVRISGMALLSVGVVPILLASLTYFLGYTSRGRQLRAAANNPDYARLCGISTDRVSLMTWGMAGGLSAVSAILAGPTSASLNLPSLGPRLLLYTMGAAAFGAFVSLPAAVGGGIGLGLLYQVVASETGDAGKAQLAVVAVILGVILVRGKAISKVFEASGSPIPERPVTRIPPALRESTLVRRQRWLLPGVGLAVGIVAPMLPFFDTEGDRFLLVLVLVYALVGVALTMLLGWGGQVSLGHFAVVGLSGYLTARLGADGWTLTSLLLAMGCMGAGVLVLVGLPALRVRGLTLTVTTLGLAVLAPEYLYLQRWIGGDTPFTTPVGRPAPSTWWQPIGSQWQLYYLTLGVLAVALLLVSSLRRSSAGRVVLAVRDNERASAALGVTPANVKLSILGASGFLAGAAGVLWAIAWQRVAPGQFGPDISMAVLAIPVIGGMGSIAGAVGASVLLYIPTFFLAQHLTGLFGSFGQNLGFQLMLGGSAIVLNMRNLPQGLAGAVQGRWQRFLETKAGALRTDDADDAVTVETSAADADRLDALQPIIDRGDDGRVLPINEVPLVVSDVEVRFGGIVALDDASIEVRPGEIVGLIGPNGAGKTTLMNVVSGLLEPERGSVQVFGHEILDLPPDVRADHRLARSFQDASLFAGLTVIETLEIAIDGRGKTGMVAASLGAPWVRESDRVTHEEATIIANVFGLEPWADSLCSQLSTGTRRIVDLAVQVATRPGIILLDEPTGGVAQREAEAFGPLVRRIRDRLDCSVLIIEHDMPLLMGLCDRVYAMEAGSVLAEGTPQEVRNDPRVIASYLGTEAAAIERSGGRPLAPTATTLTKDRG
jgi:ABC-type branched-subunit amino acid transport system ATPase component/ABC-type branched-subunit amino acid transport system permease subunit